jgi:hypothetical protein
LLETAWLKVDQGQGRFGQGGISGWGRNYWWELLGEVGGTVGENPFATEPVRVRVAYNYETLDGDPVWTDQYRYVFFPGPFRIRERFLGSRQKSAAVKFEIASLSAVSVASNEFLKLFALSMQVGLKTGVTRAAALTSF